MTARLVSLLGLPCSDGYFIDGVPEGCAEPFAACMDIMRSELGGRGVILPGNPRDPSPNAPEAPAPDGGDTSEGDGLLDGDADEGVVWASESETEN